MNDFRVGFGYDSHRLEPGLRLRLGGVDIESDRGCVAHSDGDALIHALCDALFGAAGLEDIGTHFPDTDPAYKGVDSTILLQKAVEILHLSGWHVNNADLTIILERPKLSPYKLLIKSKIAKILRVSEDVVAVKAKTNEKMGEVGRGEGVAATAIVSIVR